MKVENAIEVTDVRKQFKIYIDRGNTLKEREVLEINPNSDAHADYKILKTIGKRTARVIVIKKSVVESY